MTNPQDISAMTLSALREARDRLDSAEWALAMDAATPEQRRQSGLLLGRVHGEILRLENLELANIIDALEANGDALVAAASDVKKEVKRIAKVAKVLKTIEKLLEVAIKVVPKIAGLMGAARGIGAAKTKAKPKAKKRAAAKPARSAARRKAKPKAKAKSKAAAKPRRKTGSRRRAR